MIHHQVTTFRPNGILQIRNTQPSRRRGHSGTRRRERRYLHPVLTRDLRQCIRGLYGAGIGTKVIGTATTVPDGWLDPTGYTTRTAGVTDEGPPTRADVGQHGIHPYDHTRGLRIMLVGWSAAITATGTAPLTDNNANVGGLVGDATAATYDTIAGGPIATGHGTHLVDTSFSISIATSTPAQVQSNQPTSLHT